MPWFHTPQSQPLEVSITAVCAWSLGVQLVYIWDPCGANWSINWW